MLCETHIETHQKACCKKIKQVSQLWIKPHEKTLCYILLNTRIGEAIKEIIELIQAKDKIKAISNGRSIEKERLCEDVQGIITFIPSAVLKKKRKINISVGDKVFTKKFYLSSTIDKLKSVAPFELSGLFKVSKCLNEKSLFCEFTDDDFLLVLKDYREAIKSAFHYIKRGDQTNPFEFLVTLPELNQNLILASVIAKAATLTNADLRLLKAYKTILLLDCLIAPDYELDHMMRKFREALVDSMFRPFNFREIIKISGLKCEIDFVKKMKNYTIELLTSVYLILENGLGILHSFALSKEVSELCKSILLSKPSIKIILLMHSNVFTNKEDIESFVSSALLRWERGKNIFLWDKEVERREIFTALSGRCKTLYLSQGFQKLTVLGQALTIAHEMQHLFQRNASLLYSPPLFVEISEIRRFYEIENNGIPLEAGHLHLALLTGAIDSEETVIMAFASGNADKPGFWMALEADYPIFPQIKHAIEETNYRNLPFSLEFEPCYPFLL